MISSDRVALYYKLQSLVLNNENSSTVFGDLVGQLLVQLSSVGFNCSFAAAALKDDNNNTFQKLSMENDKGIYLEPTNLVVNWPAFFDQNSPLHKELLWGVELVTYDLSYISSSGNQGLNLKTAIISPVIISGKLSGVLILGKVEQINALEIEDQELIRLITHLLGLSFRLQYTQTSLTKITQEVYKMNAQLHQLDKLKDDFVSVASHELRTPMTAIRSYVWMAINRSDIPLSEKLKRYLQRTLISTERLINLVNDMLNISRIESGRVEIIPKEFDIQNLVTDILEEISPKAAEKHISLINLSSQTPKIFADPDKVHQVLLNLIGNSLKFTPGNGSILISYFSDGKYLDVTVKDSGVGISKDDLSRLFKKFGRLDNSYVATATSGGTGLGLFISKSLVELMGGRIWARSEGLGKGSEFTFSLPIASPEVLANAAKFTNKVEGEAKLLEPVAI